MSKKAKVAAAPQASPDYLLIAALILPLLLYFRVLNYQMVFHDDDTMILNGAAMLEKFDFKNIFFTDAWLSKQTIELYRPWQSFTYFLDYAQGKTEPFVYHLHNLLVFIASVWVLNRFLKMIEFSRETAGWLTLFYAAHYLFAHVVSWIPARGDLYLLLFGLSALMSVGKLQQTGKIWPWVPAVALLFFGSLLAKESGVVILPLSVVVMWFLGGTDALKKPANWFWLIPSLPLFGLYWWMRSQSIVHSDDVNVQALWYNLPTIPEAIAKFYFPIEFSVMPMFKGWKTFMGLGLMALMGAGIFWAVRQQKQTLRYWVLGLMLFFLPLLPSLAYKPLFAGFAYDYLDHRMFFIGTGLLILLGKGFELARGFRGDKIKYAFAIYILVMAANAYARSEAYSNFHAYYTNAIETNPKSGLALLNYSGLLRQQDKKPEQSLEFINKAIAQYPDSAIFYIEKVNDLFLLGQYDSLYAILPVLKKDDRYKTDALIFEGIYFAEKGNKEQAMLSFDAARKFNPKSPEAHFNLAKLKRNTGDLQASLTYLNEAIRLNPNYAQAFNERGNLHGNLGRFDLALKDYQRYTVLQPNDPVGIFYRGQAYCLSGNRELGCADLFRADQLGVAEAKGKIAQFCR